jgi:two-component system, chemotaxis family, CheB/CheR fusion protein
MARKPARAPSGRSAPKPPPPAAPVEPAGKTAEFIVVGVGASAGGFEAFSQLLQGIPSNPALSLVFVQHLAPRYDSALTTLLGNQTPMPVVEVTEGVRVEPNHVYVVPPNAQMALLDGHLHLEARPDDKTQYTPIDFFFGSLARTLGSRAVAVVLSGTASDGAIGIREVKAAGGTAIVQDPKTARYDGMPRAAIATRLVDLVLAPAQIATKLVELASSPTFGKVSVSLPSEIAVERRSSSGTGPRVTDEQLETVLRLLIPAGGVNFEHYKTPTILRRMMRRMALVQISTADRYIAYLEKNPEEVINLHNDLLIHVTRFFREPDTFEALASDVLPEMLDSTRTSFRAWVAGCATGEEAYSLAMVLLEAVEDRAGELSVQIFGTDVSDAAIDFARHGLYPAAILNDVSPERLRRFFTKTDGGYRVTKALRDLCVFARQDLTRDPPFSRLDLVCCRNVLIYMDSNLQRRLLTVFHYALKPSGVLLLGHAETIGHNSELFSVMNKKHRIYRKSATDVSKRGELPIPPLPVVRAVRAPLEARDDSRAVLSEAHRVVLDRYAPPSVLLDENLHIIQFNGQTSRYLAPSPGEPSFHVLKLVREGLLHGLRTALQAVRRTRRATRKTGLRVRDGQTWQDVDLEVIPVIHRNQTFFLVLFDEPAAAKKKRSGRKASPPSHAAARRKQPVSRLEEELASTREYLQSTIQEIEAANEELQSANEEVLSSNEELQSTNEELDTAKEELQSTNEELNTVNDELQSRNEELTRVNADLINLLSSVQIAIVIVSHDLRIRRFTPMAEKVLNLIPTDIGRPFSQISPNIEYPGLQNLIRESIDSITPLECEVHDKQGHWYSLRIRPYKTPDNRIDGAVIALFDIEPPKQPPAADPTQEGS